MLSNWKLVDKQGIPQSIFGQHTSKTALFTKSRWTIHASKEKMQKARKN